MTCQVREQSFCAVFGEWKLLLRFVMLKHKRGMDSYGMQPKMTFLRWSRVSFYSFICSASQLSCLSAYETRDGVGNGVGIGADKLI